MVSGTNCVHHSLTLNVGGAGHGQGHAPLCPCDTGGRASSGDAGQSASLRRVR